MEDIKHEVIVNGIPNLKNMPREEFNVFCASLLAEIEEYYNTKKVKKPFCKNL